jgi:hypothetical protein
VDSTLQGRAELERFGRSMWRRLAAFWLGGPALIVAGFILAGALGGAAGIVMLAGIAITSIAPGLTVVYTIRGKLLLRRLHELPELPHASARQLPPPSE